MAAYTTIEGIVIHKRPYRDADLWITLLTPNLGKISTLAKGVKSIKSRRLSALQLGNIIKAHIYQKNDFSWISEATSLTPFLQTAKNLTQHNLLFYFLEITNYLIAENQHIENIYPTCRQIITAINQNDLVYFIRGEVDFLTHLGFGLPSEISQSLEAKDYKTTQTLLHRYFESLIEKHLESNKLFR
jgi:DNA repair protein RecO